MGPAVQGWRSALVRRRRRLDRHRPFHGSTAGFAAVPEDLAALVRPVPSSATAQTARSGGAADLPGP